MNNNFDRRTLAAVYIFQRGRRIKRDGIVGNITWTHLFGGAIVTVPAKHHYKGLDLLPLVPIPVAPAGSAPSPAAPAPPVVTIRETVWEWTLHRKLVAVIERVPSRLPERAHREWDALISPEGLATTLTLIALFSLLSGGTALVLGVIAIGFDVLMSLAACLQIAVYAASEHELDDAADELAHIVLMIGVAVFLAGVTRAAGRLSAGKGRAASPVEPSLPNAMEPPAGLRPPEPRTPAPSAPRPRGPAPIEVPKASNRAALLKKVREVTGDSNIVFWEQVDIGNIYYPVSAGPETAARLNVRPGDIIGYVQEGAPTGTAIGDLMHLETLDCPYRDPFVH